MPLNLGRACAGSGNSSTAPLAPSTSTPPSSSSGATGLGQGTFAGEKAYGTTYIHSSNRHASQSLKCVISRDVASFLVYAQNGRLGFTPPRRVPKDYTYRHTQRELTLGFPFLAHRAMQEENKQKTKSKIKNQKNSCMLNHCSVARTGYSNRVNRSTAPTLPKCSACNHRSLSSTKSTSSLSPIW